MWFVPYDLENPMKLMVWFEQLRRTGSYAAEISFTSPWL